ncbi:MAG: hypothetical protein WBC97_06580 [Gemmatimonadales bacterium]
MDDWGTTERIKAEIQLADGAHLLGELFVQGRVAHHDGPETLVEMLNRPEPFTAVALTGDGVVFVPKSQIALIAAEEPPSPDDGGLRLSTTKLVGLELEMLGGKVLTGLVSVELPPTHHRPIDFLNEAGAFFALATHSATWIVHRAHLRGARPAD